jgi:hypothetical protein
MKIHNSRVKSLVLALSAYDCLLSLLAALLLGGFWWCGR